MLAAAGRSVKLVDDSSSTTAVIDNVDERT